MAVNLVQYLRPEVPEHDEDIDAVWIDREIELQNAIGLVREALRHPPRQPLAIQGAARVGKSHLLRRVEREIAPEFASVVRARMTAAHTDIRTLLAQLLDQVLSQLEAAGFGDAIRPVRHLRQRFGGLIDGRVASMDIATSDAITVSLKASLSASASAKLSTGAAGQAIATFLGLPLPEATLTGTLSGEASGGATNTATTTIHYGPFHPGQITSMIALAHALASSATDHRTLLIVDDFDLLKRGEDQGLDPRPLLRALCELAATPGLFVLTTVRADTYEQNKKSLFRVVNLRAFDQPDHLTEIYRKHRELWYSESGDPFPPDFVPEVARRAEGRVGLFLELLRDVFEDAGGPVNSSLDHWLEKQWERVERDDPRRAELFVEAVRDHRARFYDREKIASIRESSTARWIFEDYSSGDAIGVNPLMASFLARRAGGDRG